MNGRRSRSNFHSCRAPHRELATTPPPPSLLSSSFSVVLDDLESVFLLLPYVAK